MWSFETDPEFAKELMWMREFVDERILPLEVVKLDNESRKMAFAPLQEAVKERGLWAAHLDPHHGGQGFGQLKFGLMQEVTGRSPIAGMAFGTEAPDAGNSEILAMHGTEEQKEKYLEPMLAGLLNSAFAMTEPNAGADPTMLETSAVKVDGGWRVNGVKYFIRNASVADFMIVMVVTDPDADRYHRASELIIDCGSPGLDITREIGSMENPEPEYGLIYNHAEVVFNDVFVPESAMLGQRGEGFTVAQQRLGPGRIHHSMRWIGQASRAFDMLCERVTYRSSHGSILAEKQTIQNFIADSWSQIHAARLMTLHAAWKIDTHGVAAARTEISAIKYVGAGMLHDVIDRALQVHGVLGFSSDLPLESMYRHARAARIYDGPDEVHRQVLAKQVLKGYRPPADGIPTEHIPTRLKKAGSRFG